MMRSLDLSIQNNRELILRELLDAAQRGELSVWAGAGISCAPPASLPVALQIVQSLRKAIASTLSIPLDVLLTHQGETMRLEPFLRLIEAVSSFKDIEKLLDVFRLGRPNVNHFALASILSTHPGCAVISLNFDYLIEDAMRALSGIPPKVMIPAYQHDNVVSPLLDVRAKYLGAQERKIQIVKPHGTLIENGGTRGIIATVQGLGSGVSEALKASMTNLITDRVLLVTGYSDDDLDLFPVMQSTRPRAIYWNTLSDDLSPKVESWLLQMQTSVEVTHLLNKCEYMFSGFVDAKNVPLPSVDWQLDEFMREWVKELNSVAKIATIAAWLAQDRLRVKQAKDLYLRALEQNECKADLSLGRFVRYRYAELLRHQMEDKTNALKQYLLTLWLALRPPFDLPIITLTLRSLASALRSLSHRAGRWTALLFSITAIILLWSAMTFMRIAAPQQWSSSRLHRDKNGTWIYWEFGMLWIGLAQKLSWPGTMKRALVERGLVAFEKSQMSGDIYEVSAAIFGRARTMGMLAYMAHDYEMYSRANALLEQAYDLFILLDDATGLQNLAQLRKALEAHSSDPWLGS